MAQTTALDRVVKMVNANYETSYSGERIILVDYKKGTVLKSKPFFSFGRELRYYSVSLDRSIECEGLVCNIRDIETKHSLNIKIDYEISCLEGNQNKLVLAIYKSDNLKIAIEEYIEQWVKSFNKQKRRMDINIINSFLEEKEELKDYIIEKAQTILGLEIHPFISLDGDPETRKETSKIFPIRVSDYDEDINIRYELGLEIPNGNAKVKAILNNTRFPKVLKIIRNEVEKFMMKECTLHELCFNFNSQKKPEIVSRLSMKLKEYGRQVSYMKFDLFIDELLQPESPLIIHIAKCKINGSKARINVENEVLLNLLDLGKYKRSGIEKLEDWIQAKLDKICQEVFFERNRIDLISSLEEDKKSIQRKLEIVSRKIGYEIKHLASLPDLDELSLIQGVKVGDACEFRTSDSQVKIKLDIAINGKVKDFEGIEDHLKNGVDKFKEKILQTAKDIIEQEIREQHPADIYKSAFEGENSIDNLLKRKIKESLEEKFKLIESRISIIFLDTDLSNRIRDLKAQFPFLIFSLVPSKKSIRLPYKISYQIEGVDKDKYHTFQNNKFESVEVEIEQINDSLQEAVLKRMRDIPGEILYRSSIQDLLTLEKNIKIVMSDVAKSVFGLLLHSILIRRLETKQEEGLLAKNERILELGVESDMEIGEKSKEMMMENIELLYDQEQNLLKINDLEGAKEVRKQIKKQMQKNVNYMDDFHQMENAIGPVNHDEDSNETTLGDYLSKNNLLGPSKHTNNYTDEEKNQEDEQ